MIDVPIPRTNVQAIKATMDLTNMWVTMRIGMGHK
jgi:hypothetical protein